MTASQHFQITISCNGPSCPVMYVSEWNVPRAKVRQQLAKRGWTVKGTGYPMHAREDFCPDHKTEGA